ncbi:uncharacterized, partial [Tachysurus ichikawai]
KSHRISGCPFIPPTINRDEVTAIFPDSVEIPSPQARALMLPSGVPFLALQWNVSLRCVLQSHTSPLHRPAQVHEVKGLEGKAWTLME